MKRILLILVLLVSSVTFASSEKPFMVTRIGMDAFLRMARMAYNDELAELKFLINPQLQHFEIRGKLKIDFFRLLDPNKKKGEFKNHSYPGGYPFTLIVKPEVMDGGALRLHFERLVLLEGQSKINIRKGNFRYFVGIITILLRDTPLKKFLETDQQQNLLHFEDDYVQVRLNPEILVKNHRQLNLTNLQLWGLVMVPDETQKELYLEIALGEGTRPQEYKSRLEERMNESRSFTGLMKDQRKHRQADLIQKMKFSYLNSLLEGVLDHQKNSSEFKSKFRKGKASRVDRLKFKVSEDGETIMDLKFTVKKKKCVWYTLCRMHKYVDKTTSVYLKAYVNLESENTAKLKITHVKYSAGFIKISAGKYLTKFLMLFKGLIVKYIDKPDDDNDFLNEHLKIYVKDKSIYMDLNPRMFLSSVETVYRKNSFSVYPEDGTFTIAANIDLPVTLRDRAGMKSMLDEMSTLRNDYMDGKVGADRLAIEFGRFGKLYNRFMAYKRAYDVSTWSGLELSYITLLATDLYRTVTTYGENAGIPREKNLVRMSDHLCKMHMTPGLTALATSFVPWAEMIVDNGNSNWNKLYYEDAEKTVEMYSSNLKPYYGMSCP